ncbi:MAG: SOS response-associated peptidase [Nostocoides sp.]
MCGRYAAAASTADLVEEFDIDEDRTEEEARSLLKNPQTPPAGTPDYNMAPNKLAPVVLARPVRATDEAYATGGAHPVRQLRLLSWGLVPSWSQDPGGSRRMINARVETVTSTNAFARSVRLRRCLVPATGWYEWQVSPTERDAKGKPRKQPFFVHRGDGLSCAFAGIYDFWRDPAVADARDPMAWLVSFSVLTMAAEPGLDRIHDRQPLVLDRDRWGRWLDPEITDPVEITALTSSLVLGRFAAYPVGRAVSNNRASGAPLIEPADPAELLGVVDPATGEILDGSGGAHGR